MPTSHLTHDELFHADPLVRPSSPPTTRMDMGEFPHLTNLLKANQDWAKKTAEADPEFFPFCASGQWPKILWIGCADSRVPESIIMGRRPGEIFVHRNIANQFQPDDDSANALLDYAVLTVGVEHIIVVGHTGCGGCIAAHSSPMPSGTAKTPLGRFLDPIIRLRHSLGPKAEVNELIWKNVEMSVRNVAKSSVMRKAWDMAEQGKGQEVHVHGWIYDISTGLLQDIGTSIGPEQMRTPSPPSTANGNGTGQGHFNKNGNGNGNGN